MSVAPVDCPYIPAKYRGDDQDPTLSVMHSTVGPTKAGSARAIARYGQDPSSPSSWHYAIDAAEVIQSVYDHTVAYHCGFNDNSLAYEMCDNPSQPMSRWDDADHEAMLDRTARAVARNHAAYGIPVRFLSDARLRTWNANGRRARDGGIVTHAQMSRVFKRSTHWDPGKWPADRFLALVKKYHAALTTPEAPVTWTTPIDKDPRPVAGAITLQTVTANVRELPRHDATIKATFERAATGCQLAGFQETGNKVYVNAMRDTLENHGCHGLTGNPQHNVSMAYDKALLRHVASGYRKLFDGESGISHTRHALWVDLENRTDPSLHIIVLSVHFPSAAFDPDGTVRERGDRIATRVKMWEEAQANLVDLLEELATKGHAMVVFGDFNRQKVKALPDVLAGRKTHAVSNALDWTIYIDAADWTWTTHEANKVDIGSDHRALQNRATLKRT